MSAYRRIICGMAAACAVLVAYRWLPIIWVVDPIDSIVIGLVMGGYSLERAFEAATGSHIHG